MPPSHKRTPTLLILDVNPALALRAKPLYGVLALSRFDPA
jgi:hypothetical protein